MFDGSVNYLPGLLDSSLKFSLLISKPPYLSALALPAGSSDVIDDYRKLRNQIHLPGDLLRARHIDKLGEGLGDYLADFVNIQIVQTANRLIANNKDFNRRPLENV